eukprot:TRINITY_DN137_c0_g1_i2.p1 TRINITY_DN137_c0_g1~~TRINITY_DN137_c0_g1_i2.p1  ORF type:complete len:161 (-),score=44.23 TRINITY_DN137_c0_g1_i2:214-696(-)
MIRRPPRSTLSSSSAASDVYKRQVSTQSTGDSKSRTMLRALCLLSLAAVVLTLPTALQGDEPCCQGPCKIPGQAKYWSLATGIIGTKHCGESCMDPKDYPLYHFFEKNLTKSDNMYPCKEFGYTKYDSTPTHGFGPVKMTLDLYDLPDAIANSTEQPVQP